MLKYYRIKITLGELKKNWIEAAKVVWPINVWKFCFGGGGQGVYV